MIEYIVNVLVNKFDIGNDVAFIFYTELLNRRKIEHFILHFNEFKNFEQMKNYYLGGTENESIL